MDDVVRILVARHPETEANVARRFVSTGDTPYTATGRQAGRGARRRDRRVRAGRRVLEPAPALPRGR